MLPHPLVLFGNRLTLFYPLYISSVWLLQGHLGNDISLSITLLDKPPCLYQLQYPKINVSKVCVISTFVKSFECMIFKAIAKKPVVSSRFMLIIHSIGVDQKQLLSLAPRGVMTRPMVGKKL